MSNTLSLHDALPICRSNPAARITLPNRSNPPASSAAARSNPNPASGSGAVPPSTRTPQPAQPSRSSVPSRASFQLPAVTDEADTGSNTRSNTPPELGRGAMPKLPTRAAAAGRPEPKAPPKPAAKPTKPLPPQLEEVPDEEPAWADESAEPKAKSNAGTIGLIAVAVVLMVVVYIGATMLMK